MSGGWNRPCIKIIIFARFKKLDQMITNEQIKELQQRVETLGRCINVEDKRAEVESMTQKTLAPDFWDDPKSAEKFLKDMSAVKFWVTGYDKALSAVEDLNVLLELEDDDIDQAYSEALAEVEALELRNMAENAGRQVYFDYGRALPIKKDVVSKFKETTVKGSQFKQPLLEFSGACAGCGETPYAKLVTQLFGDRMYIANATGCSSIWGNSSPSTPYTVNDEGRGPAWANSLFEDNAEFGYGMLLAQKALRNGLKAKVEELVEKGDNPEVVEAGKEWLETFCESINSYKYYTDFNKVYKNCPHKCESRYQNIS